MRGDKTSERVARVIGNSTHKKMQPRVATPHSNIRTRQNGKNFSRPIDAQKELFAKDHNVTAAAVFGSLEVDESFVQDLSL
jgi:hypothetical protein